MQIKVQQQIQLMNQEQINLSMLIQESKHKLSKQSQELNQKSRKQLNLLLLIKIQIQQHQLIDRSKAIRFVFVMWKINSSKINFTEKNNQKRIIPQLALFVEILNLSNLRNEK